MNYFAFVVQPTAGIFFIVPSRFGDLQRLGVNNNNSNNNNNNCRTFREKLQTIQHITGESRELDERDYTHRRHQNWLSNLDFQREKQHYYKYEPKIVLENFSYELHYDRSIITIELSITIHRT
jgi:hypothetical protein